MPDMGLNNYSGGIHPHSGGKVTCYFISACFRDSPIFIAEGFGDECEDALARFDGEAFGEGFDAVVVSMRDDGICCDESDCFVVVVEVGEDGFSDGIICEGFDDEDELFFSFGISDVVRSDGIEEFDDEIGQFIARDEFFEGTVRPVEIFVMFSQEILERIDAGSSESDEEAFGQLFFVGVVGAVVAADSKARNQASGSEFGAHGGELVKVVTTVCRLSVHIVDFCLKFVGFFFGRGFKKTTQCVRYAHGYAPLVKALSRENERELRKYSFVHGAENRRGSLGTFRKESILIFSIFEAWQRLRRIIMELPAYPPAADSWRPIRNMADTRFMKAEEEKAWGMAICIFLFCT